MKIGPKNTTLLLLLISFSSQVVFAGNKWPDVGYSAANKYLEKNDGQTKSKYTILTAPKSELYKMNLTEFFSIMDAPAKFSSQQIDRMISLAADLNLDSDKRIIILDIVRFSFDVRIIPSLIQIFKTAPETNVKKQALAAIQVIYQSDKNITNYLPNHPKEKALLKNFFTEQLDKQEKLETDLIIRGFVSLSESAEIAKKMHTIINLADKDVDPFTRIGLLTAITLKSKNAENAVIPYLLNVLDRKHDKKLDERFNRYLVDALNGDQNNLDVELKHAISKYLAKTEPGLKHSLTAAPNEYIPYFAHSIWLEASSLINTKSLDEAAKYINNYVAAQPQAYRKMYVMGLSDAPYIKAAIIKEPALKPYKGDYDSTRLPIEKLRTLTPTNLHHEQ